MSVKENLIAAKALIDTPEKWEAMGKSWSRAVYTATDGWNGYYEAECALSEQRVRGYGHASILNRFDRAIAAQDAKLSDGSQDGGDWMLGDLGNGQP